VEKIVQLGEREAAVRLRLEGAQNIGKAILLGRNQAGQHVARHIAPGRVGQPLQRDLLLWRNPDLQLLGLGGHGVNLASEYRHVNTCVMTHR
jgi:hypothetical protein